MIISSYLVVLVLGLGYLVLAQGFKDCYKLEHCQSRCSSDIELNVQVDRNYSESKVNSFLVLDDYCSIPYLLNNSGFKLNLPVPVGYRDVQLPFLDLEIPLLPLTKYRDHSTSNVKERYIVNGNEGDIFKYLFSPISKSKMRYYRRNRRYLRKQIRRILQKKESDGFRYNDRIKVKVTSRNLLQQEDLDDSLSENGRVLVGGSEYDDRDDSNLKGANMKFGINLKLGFQAHQPVIDVKGGDRIIDVKHRLPAIWLNGNVHALLSSCNIVRHVADDQELLYMEALLS